MRSEFLGTMIGLGLMVFCGLMIGLNEIHPILPGVLLNWVTLTALGVSTAFQMKLYGLRAAAVSLVGGVMIVWICYVILMHTFFPTSGMVAMIALFQIGDFFDYALLVTVVSYAILMASSKSPSDDIRGSSI